MKDWQKALKLIPGGNSLFSKRPSLYHYDWPTHFLSAKDIKIKDTKNKIYEDFYFAVGTNVLGYNNSFVNKEVINSINKCNISTLNNFLEIKFAQTLSQVHSDLSMVKFAKTGGEASTIAIRIARAFNKKDKIAFCGYHGWHDWYLSSNLNNKNNLDYHLKSNLYINGVPKKLKDLVHPFNYGDIKKLEKLLKNNDLSAVIMEVAREKKIDINFLKKVQKLTKKYKCLLIFDECTSGFRTSYGGIFADYDLRPDIVIFGKAIGNGYPITTVLGKKKIMQKCESSFVSSTFWGDSIGFAAGEATLKYMRENMTAEIIKNNSTLFQNIWSELSEKYNLPIEIKGTIGIPSFSFINRDNNICKQYLTQNFLRNKILATNMIYLSILHNKKNIKNYYLNLKNIFNSISLNSDKNLKSKIKNFKNLKSMKRYN